MDNFFEKFGFILYYVVVTFFFLIYYSSKYNINLSRIGNIAERFDIANRGRKFWVVLIVAIIFLMSIPSIVFSSNFQYDWVRIVSQIILIAIIMYRYVIVGIFFGDLGMYLFDDVIYWENVKSYSIIENKNNIRLSFEFNDNKIKVIDFPFYLKSNIENILAKYINNIELHRRKQP